VQPSIQASGNSGTQEIKPNEAVPHFVKAPPSFEIWKKKAISYLGNRDIAEIVNLSPQEIARLAYNNQDFLMATAVLADQSPAGSAERNFADRIFRAVEQGIQTNLSAAMVELDKFSRKGEFQGRYLEWVRFLAGETVAGLRYPNCQAFRVDSDIHLENYHDYVQVVFPSWEPSGYHNKDLYIRDKVETWKALIKECPSLARNIQLNIQLNAIRMLHFWGYRFYFTQDAPNVPGVVRVFVNLEDNPNSPLHKLGDHNELRVTRFLEALVMFGCFGGLFHIFAEGFLPEYYAKHPSFSKYWVKVFEGYRKTIPDLYWR
jgi:hypothetical protein